MAVRHLVSWCLLLLAQPAFAHEDHESHPIHAHADTLLLDLAQAIALGANNGPEVIKSKATHAAGRDLEAAASPFMTQLPYIQTQLGPRLSRGALSPEVIVGVNQPFTLGDTAGVQKRVARATSQTLTATTRSAELSAARRAADAWITLALADRTLKLRREFAEQAKALVALARARVTAGEAEPVELALAESELADAHSLVIDAEGLHYTAELELSYAIGAPRTHVDVRGELTQPPPAPIAGAATLHPDVEAAERRAALALNQVAYAKVQQAPTLAVGIQYQREGTGDQILTAVATIPLPVASPWEFQMAQQRLAAVDARAEANLVRTMTDKQRQGAAHELDHTRAQYEYLLTTALPPLREAHRLAVLRYTHGETDISAVSLIRQRLLRTEERVTEALARVQMADVELRALAGELLKTGRP